ncbi:hypothetical protein [Nonomuraea maheshkhaliensis]|uniref:hypothetical protein n=1 Tax=Nonomuraea maheshkhaliensis TaxID=419590 RepID=UPI0031F7B029
MMATWRVTSSLAASVVAVVDAGAVFEPQIPVERRAVVLLGGAHPIASTHSADNVTDSSRFMEFQTEEG